MFVELSEGRPLTGPYLLQERVLRSCAGELERETAAVLYDDPLNDPDESLRQYLKRSSPLGIDDSLSRRVAGALLAVEATLPIPSPPPSMFRQCLTKIARRPKFSNSRDEEASALLPPSEEDDRGLTAFLLKFGEGLEEVSDSRLFISAFTIGAACAWPIYQLCPRWRD